MPRIYLYVNLQRLPDLKIVKFMFQQQQRFQLWSSKFQQQQRNVFDSLGNKETCWW